MWNHYDIDVVDDLTKRKIISICEADFMKRSLKFNGFVSGSFARLTVLNILCNQKQDMPEVVQDSCCNGRITSMLRNMSIDVDIFFRNHTGSKLAAAEVRDDSLIRSSIETKGGWGIEYTSKSMTKFQHITKTQGSPQEILDGFDLANAKVYFDSSGIYWTDEWLDLERHRTLGIDRLDKQNLMWRVNKWSGKHGYKQIRKDDEELFFEHVIAMITKMKNNRFFRFQNPVTVNEGLGRVWSLTKILDFTPETLISFAMLFDSYRNITLMKKVAGSTCAPAQ